MFNCINDKFLLPKSYDAIKLINVWTCLKNMARYLLCVAFVQMPRGWMECLLREDRLSQTTSEANIRV